MLKIIPKGLAWYSLVLLLVFSCSGEKNEKVSNSLCPYAANDHLEYWNHGMVVQTDGLEGENEAHIIYEVEGIEQTPRGIVVRFKNYYSDTTGVMEEYDVKFVYSDKRVYFYRPDGSIDSLKFLLGDNTVRTLEDYVDSLGYHHVVKIAENNAAIQTRKGRLFKGCLKLEETIYESKKSQKDFVFHKISYYKDTILIKYMSINRMDADKEIKELRTQSELEDYNVFAWR